MSYHFVWFVIIKWSYWVLAVIVSFDSWQRCPFVVGRFHKGRYCHAGEFWSNRSCQENSRSGLKVWQIWHALPFCQCEGRWARIKKQRIIRRWRRDGNFIPDICIKSVSGEGKKLRKSGFSGNFQRNRRTYEYWMEFDTFDRSADCWPLVDVIETAIWLVRSELLLKVTTPETRYEVAKKRTTCGWAVSKTSTSFSNL